MAWIDSTTASDVRVSVTPASAEPFADASARPPMAASPCAHAGDTARALISAIAAGSRIDMLLWRMTLSGVAPATVSWRPTGWPGTRWC